jgi:hypothetical protein
MKLLLLLVMLLPLTAFGEEDSQRVFENFIRDDGYIVRNGYSTGERYPLTKRHWFQTTMGKVDDMFIDIPAINIKNGYCDGGTAFKPHESGALIMKCFDFNGGNMMERIPLFVTKDHHYFTPGFCDSRGKYTIFSPDCKPGLYYSMADVGDKLPPEECAAIMEKAEKYNFDFICQ